MSEPMSAARLDEIEREWAHAKRDDCAQCLGMMRLQWADELIDEVRRLRANNRELYLDLRKMNERTMCHV